MCTYLLLIARCFLSLRCFFFLTVPLIGDGCTFLRLVGFVGLFANKDITFRSLVLSLQAAVESVQSRSELPPRYFLESSQQLLKGQEIKYASNRKEQYPQLKCVTTNL